MAQPIAGTVTMSSAGTTAAIGLDPTARMTNVQVTWTSAATGNWTLQATLDVPTGSNTITYDNVSTTHYSSTSDPGLGALTFISPISGLRLSSTTFTAGSVTLSVLQSVIA